MPSTPKPARDDAPSGQPAAADTLEVPDLPISQNATEPSSWKPLWLSQFPKLRFDPPQKDFQLLNPKQLAAILEDVEEPARRRIERDIAYLDHQVLRLFRERDYLASFHQNRYRMFQLAYMFLALLATIIGSLLALSLQSSPAITPYLGALEAILAGFTTFFATLSTDEPPQQLWLQNRLRAEFLRREYFRYLMNLAPYSDLPDFDREQRLALRAADINRGVFPENNAHDA